MAAMSAAESIGRQLSKVTIRAKAKIEDLAARANNSGDPRFVSQIHKHFTGTQDVWEKFVFLTGFFETAGNKSYFQQQLWLPQPKAKAKAKAKAKLKKKKPSDAPAAAPAAAAFDWVTHCENEEIQLR